MDTEGLLDRYLDEAKEEDPLSALSPEEAKDLFHCLDSPKVSPLHPFIPKMDWKSATPSTSALSSNRESDSESTTQYVSPSHFFYLKSHESMSRSLSISASKKKRKRGKGSSNRFLEENKHGKQDSPARMERLGKRTFQRAEKIQNSAFSLTKNSNVSQSGWQGTKPLIAKDILNQYKTGAIKNLVKYFLPVPFQPQ